MILLEVALQGIRGFSPLTRFTVRPGMNVGRTTDPLVRRALLDVIYHSLYPDSRRADATSRLADPSAKESRIGVTYFGRDKNTYRIVREAVSGAVSLHRFDTVQSKFTILTRSTQEASQFVRVQEQIPDDASYERLFMFSPETMPSLGDRAKMRSGAPIASAVAEGLSSASSSLPQAAGSWPSGPSGTGGLGLPASSGGSGFHAQVAAQAMRQPSMAGRGPPGARGKSAFGSPYGLSNALAHAEMVANDATSSRDLEPAEIEEKRVLLLKLKSEAAYARKAEKSQVDLDKLNARRAELQKQVQQVTALENQISDLQRQVDAEEQVLDLSHGFADRLTRYEEAHARYLAEKAKTEAERRDLEQYLFENPMLVLWRDLYFLSGIAFAAVAIVVANVVKPIIALLNIPSLMVAGAAAFRWVGDLEERARTKVRLNAVLEREQRLHRQYDLDTAAVRRVLERLGADTHELRARIEAAEEVRKKLRTAQAELAVLTSVRGVAEARLELERSAHQIEEVEAVVLGSQGILSSETLGKKIAALEKEIAAAERSSDITMLDANALKELAPGASPHVAAALRSKVAPVSAPPSDSLPPSSGAQRRAVPVVPGKAVSSGPVRNEPGSEALFDVSGGDIGIADDDEPGYGSGYGTSRGSSSAAGPGTKPGPKPGSKARSDLAGDEPGGVSSAPMLAIGAGGGSGGLGGGAGGGGGGLGGGAGGGGGGSGDLGSGGLASAYAEVSSTGSILAPDRSRDLVRAAVDVLHIPTDVVAEKLGDRVRQYLTAFTDDRYRSASFGARGEVNVIPAEEGPPVPFMSLAGEDLDLVDSALRFALVEACIHVAKLPILIDDPFLGFPISKRMLFSQMISYLAKGTQIFLLTENEDVTGHEVTW